MPKKASNFLVNPTGNFVVGGPDGDCGLTGRKIIVDTYGGYAPHGGGAFSGKDPTKVDRSAAYATRYLAKNIVAAGLADRCTIQVAYAIGVADPMSLLVDLHGTGKVDERKLEKILAGTVPSDADQHPSHAQAEPPDLSPHRVVRPLRPRAGEGRRLLVGEDRPRQGPEGGFLSCSTAYFSKFNMAVSVLKLRDCASFGLPGHVRLGVLLPQSQAALKRAWTRAAASASH